MQTKEVIIKYKNTERYKCAKREMKKMIDKIILKRKLYNNSKIDINESPLRITNIEVQRENKYK